ncbi:unnamed protein product [Thlaspi arvense]|uniref:Protein kinase domain-containing protein n=1 Tax=Thlaspi arvense TaxID=13288 RepID=A0AAU9SN25_THLAR|nr:unnamed protein product [Thlaspi arvense]
MPARRRHSYGGGSSPATASSYSTSTFTDRSSPPATDKSSSIARWISGIFKNCFTPPDSVSSKDFDDSEHNIRSRRSSTGSVQRHYYGNANERQNQNERFSFDEIYAATKNFSPSFRIGQGGFGTVYKVKLRDGTTVAIKRAKKSLHDQGAEFTSEIQTLAQVTHLSLVKYYGFLVHNDEKLLIVEYVANGNLRDHLDCKEGKILDMATRLDIATDVAHAITYLHMYTQRITIRWAIKKFTSGDTISVLDPKLERNPANNLALEKVLEMAFQCLAPHRGSRPTMKKCSEILWGIRKDYRELLNTSL